MVEVLLFFVAYLTEGFSKFSAKLSVKCYEKIIKFLLKIHEEVNTLMNFYSYIIVG